MPIYDYRCPSCGISEHSYPMREAPPALDCACGLPARKLVTAARLGKGSSTAMRLLDQTGSTASEPAVVRSPPPAAPNRPVSRNPLHAKLPRPGK
ncbi:FmdB family zinc ribbon protein [Sciscionella sediminilitoris]|uniref:FmdB family zinc ribbon protein n=1 Tax=Sciscionella sediminilitoris TaxID=1445613 RepID=UPI0004DF6B27|nr:FmdB family zinc ribbon protein [Sciscionella sp. SE31]